MYRAVCVFLSAVLFFAASGPLSGQFVNATVATGISIPSFAPTANLNLGRGAAWADFDGDGDLDLFAAGGFGNDIRLFTNNGSAGFTSTVVYALSTTLMHHAAVAADFDNDGDQDVYVCCGQWQPNLFFINQGSGTFTEEATARGVDVTQSNFSTCASWGDFDRDGRLDLYVGDYFPAQNFSGPLSQNGTLNRLFRNLGTGSFVDVTAAAGVGGFGQALAVLWWDQNGDMWPDLYVGNDRGSIVAPNWSYRNGGVAGFTSIGPSTNSNAPIATMGVTIGDIENDGDFDMYLTNRGGQQVLLIHDASTGAFLPPAGTWWGWATARGVQTASLAWGCNFFDYDADGLVDLFVSTEIGFPILFRNIGGGSFADVTFAQGIPAALPPGYSSSFADFDDDGDLDLFSPSGPYAAQIAENQCPQGNWLSFRLHGTISNRDAKGTLIRVASASGSRIRMATSGEGYQSDSDPRPHFGLGTDSIATSVEFRWPSGSSSRLANVAVNQRIDVWEPSFQLGAQPAPGQTTSLTMDAPSDVGLSYVVALTTSLSSELALSDGRRIRVDQADPIVGLSLSPNPYFSGNLGVMPIGGAVMTLTIPALPWLTGIEFLAVGVTIDFGVATGIGTIVGPQRIVIG